MTDTTVTTEQDDKTKWQDMANRIAREFWETDYTSRNPDASKEDTATAWREAASDYRKTTKQALRRLSKKKGIIFSRGTTA